MTLQLNLTEKELLELILPVESGEATAFQCWTAIMIFQSKNKVTQ